MNTPESAPDFIDELMPPRDGLPMITRTVVQCIVRHPRENAYLLLKRNWETPSYSFVTGGIEGDEDPIAAGIREVIEETGYTDIDSQPVIIGEPYGVQFYHELKKENRRAIVWTISLRLKSLVVQEVDLQELEKHTPVWIPESEVITTVHGDGCKKAFALYLLGHKGE